MVVRRGFTVVVYSYKINKSYDGKGTWDSGIEGRRDGGREEKEQNGGMERVGARVAEGGRDKEGGRERGREGGREGKYREGVMKKRKRNGRY